MPIFKKGDYLARSGDQFSGIIRVDEDYFNIKNDCKLHYTLSFALYDLIYDAIAYLAGHNDSDRLLTLEDIQKIPDKCDLSRFTPEMKEFLREAVIWVLTHQKT